MRYVFRNILRFPKKTLVVFVLVSIILLLSMAGTFVITLCGEISSRTVGPLGGTVVVSDEDGKRIMSYDAARYLADASDAITEVDATAEFSVQPMGAECIDGAEKVTVAYDMYAFYFIKERSGIKFDSLLSRDMKLVAVTTADICREFYNGDAEIVEGANISREDNENENLKIVVSDEFAKLNGLSLGDRVKINALSLFLAPPDSLAITVSDESGEKRKEYRLPFSYEDYIAVLGEKLSTITFVVGGIYHNYVDNKNISATPADIADNRVYVPISTVSKKLSQIKSDPTFMEKRQGFEYIQSIIPTERADIQYFFPQDLDCVPTRLYMRLSDMSLSDDLEEAINGIGFYNEIKLTPFITEAGTSPAAKILIIVRYSLLGVMIAGFAILALVIFFNMNSRRQEFSVLAALGKKRLKIALSFFGEIFIVFLAATIICAAVYAVTVRSVAAPISKYLEDSEKAGESSEMRLSGLYSENQAERQRAENMSDMRFLTENYIVPSIALTLAATFAVLLITLVPVYISAKKINPLTDSGGKE